MNKHHEDLYDSLVPCAQIRNNWQRTAQKGREGKPTHFIVGLYFGTRHVETVKLEDCSAKL